MCGKRNVNPPLSPWSVVRLDTTTRKKERKNAQNPAKSVYPLTHHLRGHLRVDRLTASLSISLPTSPYTPPPGALTLEYTSSGVPSLPRAAPRRGWSNNSLLPPQST